MFGKVGWIAEFTTYLYFNIRHLDEDCRLEERITIELSSGGF